MNILKVKMVGLDSTSGRYYWPTSGKVTFFGYGGVAICNVC